MTIVPTILVIERDDDTARLIADFLRVLSAPSFHVVIAHAAGEALTIPTATRIDCIVLDCDLPECSGPTCMPDIRRRWPSLPVIVITGFGSEELAVQALKQYGATDYVPKRGNYLPTLLHCVRDGVCRAVFREDGLAWRIGYQGCETELPPLKGLHYIHQLLQDAGRFVPATQLAGYRAAGPLAASIGSGRENGIRISHDLGNRGPTLDRKALAEYRARLRELVEIRTEARISDDAHTESEVDAEVDGLRKELGRARRCGGWDDGHRNRARVCVSKGLDRAVGMIGRRLSGLGSHLRARIQKGYDCIYIPDPRWPLEWDL